MARQRVALLAGTQHAERAIQQVGFVRLTKVIGSDLASIYRPIWCPASVCHFRVIGRHEGMAVSPFTVPVACPWFRVGGLGRTARDGRAGAVTRSELIRGLLRQADRRLRRAGQPLVLAVPALGQVQRDLSAPDA